MAPADPDVLVERVAAVRRHLRRVADQPPTEPSDLLPETAASDAVVLHLWQAVQLTIDLAVSWCVRAGLGTPPTYGDAFRRLAAHGLLDAGLADRLTRAVGLRDLIVHAYADLDLRRVHDAAVTGAPDLLAFAATPVRHEGIATT